MTASQPQAELALRAIVTREYGKRSLGLLGSSLKVLIDRELREQNLELNLRTLGFGSFIAFVKAVSGLSVIERQGSDFVVVPEGMPYGEIPSKRPAPAVRSDFWKAFISFPIKAAKRTYDPATDKVFYDPEATERSGVTITPLSRDEQWKLRLEFIQTLGDFAPAELKALSDSSSEADFFQFSRIINRDTSLGGHWRKFFQEHVVGIIKTWADNNSIEPSRWFVPPRSGFEKSNYARPTVIAAPTSRTELYELLDRIPLDDILQLRMPLEWFLKASREFDK